MKKIFVFSTILLALAGATASAESWTDLFKLSAWGRAVVTPYAFSNGDSSVSAATYSSGYLPVIGFSVSGMSPTKSIGFQTDLSYNGGSVAIGDNAKVWVSPFSFAKLTAGWFVEDDFRGTIGNTQFASWLLPNSGKAEDAIFTRFQGKLGAHFKVEPLAFLDSDWNGLMIEGAFGSNKSPLGSATSVERANRALIGLNAADVYKNMQIGVGYKVPKIGFARVQFIGNNRKAFESDNTTEGGTVAQSLTNGLSTNTDADVLEAAFQFTGVDGLNVDVGAKYPFSYTTTVGFTEYPALPGSAAVITADGVDERIVQRPFSVSLAANWTPSFLSNLNLIARTDLSFGGTIEEKNVHRLLLGTDVAAWLLPSYKLVDRIRVGTDLAMEIHLADQWQQPIGVIRLANTKGSDFTDFGVGPWVELDLGWGTVKTGAFVMLPGSARWTWVSGNYTGRELQQTFSGKPIVSFPISMTYSF